MPRSRATEMPQRPSPRAPANFRTATSYSDPTHHRSRTDRSPNLSTGRSPPGSQSDPVCQKKLGSRIADLESQVGQAQDELKCLKSQLSSAEAAKRAAQEQLEKKLRKPQKNPNPLQIQEKHSTIIKCETSDDVGKDTDVFEVPVDELNPRSFDELALKNDDINSLKIKLDEKGREVEILCEENKKMKMQINEKNIKISSNEDQIEELNLKLEKANRELDKSKSREGEMREEVEAIEKAKEELENEMKRLRVQMEQWRKSADAAASVLAGEVEIGEKDELEPGVGGYRGYVRPPDDGVGGGKRKGSGIRMLWRKKGSK